MKRMLIGGAVGLALSCLLVRQANRVDVSAHEKLMQRFAAVHANDDDVKTNALALRYGYIISYDALVEASDLLLKDVEALGDQAPEELRRAVVARRADVERFKPKNARLINSLRYLPSATNRFADAARAAGAGDAVVAAARGLEAVTYLGDAEHIEQADAGFKAALAAANRPHSKQRGAEATEATDLADAGASLRSHATRVAEDRFALRPLLERLVDNSVERATSKAEASATRQFNAALATEHVWRLLLGAWGAALLLVIVLLVRRLLTVYENLEQLVRERTRALKTILDHVSSGFLLVGRDLTVRGGHSQSCAALLGDERLEGRPLKDVLRATPDQAAWLEIGVDQAFSDVLPEEAALAQLPSRFEVAGRTLRLVPRLVREGGTPRWMLLTLDDITPLEAAERTAQRNQLLVRILKDKQAFLSFIKESHAQLSSVDPDDEASARRAVHTVKGAAASFDLGDIAGLCHAIEEKAIISRPELKQLECALDAFLEENEDVLELRAAGTVGAVGGSTDSVDLLELGRLVDEEDLAGLRAFLVAQRRKPFRALLGPLPAYATSLGERLKKPVNVEVRGGDLLVDAERFSPLFALLPHLVRNAIDHGIEERGARGSKPSVGSIIIEAVERDEDVALTVSDDGRGIDTRALAAAAGIVEEQAGVELAFANGISTAETVTDISGRGVGLSAVKETIEKMGGRVTLISTPGTGTTVTLTLRAHKRRNERGQKESGPKEAALGD